MSGNRAVLPVIRLAARSSIPPPAIHPRCTRRYRQFPVPNRYGCRVCAPPSRVRAPAPGPRAIWSPSPDVARRCRRWPCRARAGPPHRRVEIACCDVVWQGRIIGSRNAGCGRLVLLRVSASSVAIAIITAVGPAVTMVANLCLCDAPPWHEGVHTTGHFVSRVVVPLMKYLGPRHNSGRGQKGLGWAVSYSPTLIRVQYHRRWWV